MKTNSLFLHAKLQPLEGIVDPLPTQKYKDPETSVRQRELGTLDEFNVRAKILYAGICGTDLHLVSKHKDTGYTKCTAPVEIPNGGRVIGHEAVGQAIEVGKYVKHVEPGDYLAFESIVACQHCSRCRKGLFNQCRESKLLGLEKDGLYSPIADVPGSLAHSINDSIKSESDIPVFAGIEPAAVAYLACQNACLKGADKVVIFGAGPIGLYSAIIAKTVFGASEINLVEPIPFRRNLAREWCDNCFDVDEFFGSPPREIDVVIESSGVVKNLNKVFRKINANGRAVMLGRSGEPLSIDATDHMITNAISIVGSRGHLGGAFHDLMNLYHRGRIPLGAPITETIHGLDSLKDYLDNPEKVLMKNCKVLVSLGESA